MAKLIVPTETKKDPLIHKRINKTPVNKESIEAMTPETDKKVTGTFVNVEAPGQAAPVNALLYKGMEYFTKVMNDNEEYTIPLSVARFINERCCHYRHSYLLDGRGNPIKEEKPTPRYKFIIERLAA